MTRWVLLPQGGKLEKDLGTSVIDSIGSNGEAVELLFVSREQAEEYNKVAMLDAEPVEVKVTIKPSTQGMTRAQYRRFVLGGR